MKPALSSRCWKPRKSSGPTKAGSTWTPSSRRASWPWTAAASRPTPTPFPPTSWAGPGVGDLTFGPRASLVRRQHGGGQERGRRAGTENLPGIAGFAAAARAALRDRNDNKVWRDAAIEDLKAAGGVIVGEDSRRLDGTLCVAYPGFPAERQVMALDLAGVMISAGSACSSGKVKASHVLQAMGLNDLAACAIRVSGGWSTTASDWSAFVGAWRAMTSSFTARRASAA